MTSKKAIRLEISGVGFIIYSPFATSHIAEGEDYLETGFVDSHEVERQAIEGKLVGVCTSSPGTFLLEVLEGYPSDDTLGENKYKLRLGVEVRDTTLCIRDLYDLIDWSSDCPAEQALKVENGFYHVTLLSGDPPSGVLGDDQRILLYLQKLNEMPLLRFNGVPTLC